MEHSKDADLIEAIRNKNLAKTHRDMEHSQDVDLIEAIRNKNLAKTHRDMEHSQDADLIEAIRNKNLAKTHTGMEHLQDADLIEAIRNKNLAKTLECLCAGADPDALDGDTPLIVVSMVQGCEETALALIDAGCKVNLTTIRKDRGMQHMISLPCMAYRIRMHRVLKRLLHHPCCDVSQTDYSQNNTIMHLAVRRGDMTLVDALLPKGLLLLTNRQGFTPLHLAARSGNVELMHTFFNQWRRENGVRASFCGKTAGVEAVDDKASVLEANTDSEALTQPLSSPLHTPDNEAGVLKANTDSKALAQPLSSPLHTPNNEASVLEANTDGEALAQPLTSPLLTPDNEASGLEANTDSKALSQPLSSPLHTPNNEASVLEANTDSEALAQPLSSPLHTPNNKASGLQANTDSEALAQPLTSPLHTPNNEGSVLEANTDSQALAQPLTSPLHTPNNEASVLEANTDSKTLAQPLGSPLHTPNNEASVLEAYTDSKTLAQPLTSPLHTPDNEASVLEANTDSNALSQPLSSPLHTPNPGRVVSLAVTGVGPAKAERNDSVLDMAFSYMTPAHINISVPTGEAFRTETRTSDSLRLTFPHHKQKNDKTVAGKVLDSWQPKENHSSWQPKENHSSSSSESLNAESTDGFLHSLTLPEVEACLVSMSAEQVCETWPQWRQAGPGCCRKLVEHTATHTGNTMLHQAAKGAHVKLLKYLLAHGADVNSLSTCNKTPLMCLVSDAGLTTQAEEAARALVDAGCDVNLLGPCSELRHNSCHTSAVRVAAGRNSIRMVDLLVHAGASLSASSQPLDCGDTALLAALKHNACEVSWHLLTHYPHHLHPHHADREGNTALHLVVSLERRRKAITQMLLKLGADFLCENRSGHSPLALAVRRNGAEAMEMFLQHQPDFLLRPHFSWTCMLSDCGRFPHQSKGKQLQVLLRYGADINQVQADGRTALEGLLAGGCIDEAFFLTQRGCRVRDNSVTRSFQRFHSDRARQHSQDTIRKQSLVSVETTGRLHQGDRERSITPYSQTNALTSLTPSLTFQQRTVTEGDIAHSYSQTKPVSSLSRFLTSEQGELSVEGKVEAIVSYIARYLHAPCSLQSLCLDAIRHEVRTHRSDFFDAARLPLPHSIINVILYRC